MFVLNRIETKVFCLPWMTWLLFVELSVTAPEQCSFTLVLLSNIV